MAAPTIAPISVALEGFSGTGRVATPALLGGMLHAAEKISDLIFSPGRPPQGHQYRARAFAREFPCQTRANTGRGAGNQYNLSVESVPPGSRHGNTILALSATIHTPAQELNRRKAGRPKTSSPQWSHLRPIHANSEGHPSPRGNEASDVLPEQHVPEYLKGQGPCSQSRILAVLAASGPAVRPSDATARSTDIRMMSAEASCWIAEASPGEDWDPPPPVAWPTSSVY